jgi:alginate O-acetyltransferase complex protein AlgI
LVNVTWVFFRAPDFGKAALMLLSMFGVIPNGVALLSTPDMLKVAIITVLLVAFHWLMRNTSLAQVAARLPWWLLSLIWTSMVILLILSQKSSGSFIYFQF